MTMQVDPGNASESALEVDPSTQALEEEAREEPPVKRNSSCCTGLKAFVAALSFSYFSKAFSGAVMKSSITQLERRFGISSSTVGFVDGSFEMGNLLVIAFVSYYGAKFHQPRVIALGCFIMSLGTFLTAMPHFFMGYYEYETQSHSSDNTTSYISPCSGNQTVTGLEGIKGSDCRKETLSNTWIYVMLGNALRGIGETPIAPLGLSYLDDFSKEEDTPLFIGILHTVAMIGPLAGHLLGSLFAKLYVDIGFVDMGWPMNTVEGCAEIYEHENHSLTASGALFHELSDRKNLATTPPIGVETLLILSGGLFVTFAIACFQALDAVTITPTDSRWVGAWWLSFLVGGVLSLICAIPFCFLPKSLKREDEAIHVQKPLNAVKLNGDERQIPKSETQEAVKETSSLKDFFRSLKRALDNRTFFVLLCISLLQVSSFVGDLTYERKYMEQQYGQSVSKSNFVTGLFIVPAVSLASLLGGYIMKKYKIGIIGATKMAFGTNFVAFLISLLYLATGCENHKVAGLTVSYEGQSVPWHANSLSSTCNSDCNCATNQWDPVCREDGITYVSACFAGCKDLTGSGKNTVFHNCSCFEHVGFMRGNLSAILGECPRSEDCSRKFMYFTAIKIIASFVHALGGTPAFMILIRCVRKELKSLSIGLFLLIMRSLGGILAPVYFGAVIDRTCLKWARSSCGKQGACRLYNSTAFRYSFWGLVFGLKAPSYLLGILLLWLVKKHFGRKDVKAIENGKKEDGPLNEDANPNATDLVPGTLEADKETIM